MKCPHKPETVKCTTALVVQICYAKLGKYQMAIRKKNTIMKR